MSTASTTRARSFDFERFRNDVLALGLLAVAVFVGLSFLSYDPADPPSTLVFPTRRSPINICGSTGASIAFHGRQCLGMGVWAGILSLIAWDLALFSREKPKRNWLAIGGTLLFVICSCAVLHLLMPTLDSGSTYGSGGLIGAWLGIGLTEAFSPVGVFILLACGLISGWMLSPLWAVTTPGLKLASIPMAVGSRFMSLASALKPAPRAARAAEDAPSATLSINTPLDYQEEVAEDEYDDEEEADDDEDGEDRLRINPPVALSIVADEPVGPREYDLPGLELLEEPEDFPYEELATKARLAAATLEKTFSTFGLNIKVSEVDTGPAVTQFELDLEPGLRLNKVTSLEDDLAIALRVPSCLLYTSPSPRDS